MALKTTIDNKGGLVDRHINTSYDTVKIVADNIEFVLSVGAYIDGGQIDAAIAAAVTTAADVVITNNDVLLTAADVISTNSDAVDTAADRVAVESLYDQFDDRYLGSKSVAPTLDNDGGALLTGALYWDSVALSMYVYTGSGWSQAYNASLGISDSAASAALFIDADKDVYAYGQGGVTNNTAFGKGIFTAGATGASNTAFGDGALNSLTTAIGNIAVGNNALAGLTTGLTNLGYNVAIGTSAGALCGIDIKGNTIVGYEAGKSLDGSFSTYIGYQSGAANSQVNASNNVGVGASSLVALTTGTNNVAVGNNALALITSGLSNTAIGVGAAAASGIAQTNGVFVGYNSGNKVNGLYPVFVGYQAGGGGIQVAANYNIAIGSFALEELTTGDNNTAVGHEAGHILTTGSDNTYIGFHAGDAADTESNNTAVGSNALASNNSGTDNAALGYFALGGTTGGFNVGIGSEAGAGMGSSVINATLIGYRAGYFGSGNDNTYVGFRAGYGVTLSAGNSNVALGAYALEAIDASRYHVAIGFEAMKTEDGGGWGSVAIGYQALKNANNGGAYSGNVAVGHAALTALTTGSDNTAIGSNAGVALTTGGTNVFIGPATGTAMLTGSNNIAIGKNALLDPTATSQVVAIGVGAGQNIGTATNGVFIGHGTGAGDAAGTSGAWNTAVGSIALGSFTSGRDNTAIGYAASFNISTGQNNTTLGYDAGITGSPFNITTESHRVVIGDDRVTNAYVKVAWTITSDARDKTDIEDIPYGLDFVTQLNPVTFFWDDRSQYEDGISDGSKKGDLRNIGFLAQDIVTLEESYGVEDLLIADNEQLDNLKISETKMIPVLVQAIKELKTEIDTLKGLH